MFPRFDGGVLNPDLRFLRAGEIMEGVKCATAAFMHEREQQLLRDRKAEMQLWHNKQHKPGGLADIETREAKKNEAKNFKVYGIHVPAGVPDSCDRKDHHWEKGGCLSNECEREEPALGVTVWDYKKKLNAADAGCAPIPDYSRFALDPTQTASVQLTLLTNNTGQVNMTKIDANLLDPRHFVIAPGGGPNGAPFPQFLFSDKLTASFDAKIQMPQTVHGFIYAPAAIPRLTNVRSGSPALRLSIQELMRSAGKSLFITLEDKSIQPNIFREPATPEEEFNRVQRNAGKIIPLVEARRGMPIASGVEEDVRLAKDIAQGVFSTKPWTPTDIAAADEAVKRLYVNLKSLDRLEEALTKISRLDELERLSSISADLKGVQVAASILKRNISDDSKKIQHIDRNVDAIAIAGNKDVDNVLNGIGRWATDQIELAISKLDALKPTEKLQDAIGAERQISEQKTVILQLLPLVPLDKIDFIADRVQTAFKRVNVIGANVRSEILPGFGQVQAKQSRRDSFTKTPNDFYKKCNFEHSRLKLDGDWEVDYLGLKSMLDKFIQDKQDIYLGTPEISLDELVLTSAFVVTIDASAGMSHLFRIFPLIIPPAAQFKTDHTHTLKITFKGQKQKKNTARQKNLVESCKGRFQTQLPPDEDICNTQMGLLLEQLIQNSQSSGGSSSSSSSGQ